MSFRHKKSVSLRNGQVRDRNVDISMYQVTLWFSELTSTLSSWFAVNLS